MGVMRAAWLGCALLAGACRHRAPPRASDAALPPAFVTVRDASVRHVAVDAGPVAPWCVRPLPHAAARALDRHGHRWALDGFTLRDETAAGRRIVLAASDPPCPVSRDALWFGHDGSATAVARGRIYLRAPGAQSPWTVTPMCTDLDGEPWAMRPDNRGWAVVGRRFPGHDAALLMTDDPTARVGWYALTALDPTMSSVLLEGDGSMLTLSAGGHLVVIDRDRHVAGEVLAASQALYANMTRSGLGIVVSRDVDATTREVVTGTGLQQPFRRDTRARPPGPVSRRVFALGEGALLATTDRGVETSRGPDQPFVEVARWLTGDGTSSTLGWSNRGAPIVAFHDGWMSTSCTEIE